MTVNYYSSHTTLYSSHVRLFEILLSLGDGFCCCPFHPEWWCTFLSVVLPCTGNGGSFRFLFLINYLKEETWNFNWRKTCVCLEHFSFALFWINILVSSFRSLLCLGKIAVNSKRQWNVYLIKKLKWKKTFFLMVSIKEETSTKWHALIRRKDSHIWATFS